MNLVLAVLYGLLSLLIGYFLGRSGWKKYLTEINLLKKDNVQLKHDVQKAISKLEDEKTARLNADATISKLRNEEGQYKAKLNLKDLELNKLVTEKYNLNKELEQTKLDIEKERIQFQKTVEEQKVPAKDSKFQQEAERKVEKIKQELIANDNAELISSSMEAEQLKLVKEARKKAEEDDFKLTQGSDDYELVTLKKKKKKKKSSEAKEAKRVLKKAMLSDSKSEKKKKKVEGPSKVKSSKKGSTLDDLKIIEGIGPKMEAALRSGGITTYKDLASRSPEEINRILIAQNPRYKMAYTKSWPKQAKLASEGAFDKLKALQDELDRGR